MKKRRIKAAMDLARHMQKNIEGHHYYAAWGQASGLQAMLECELGRKKKEKSNENV